MKIRAFLAFDIPQKVKKTLGLLMMDFAKKETGVKWIAAENLHVTMKFFGDVDESLLLKDISHAITSVTHAIRPMSLRCQGLGVFPNWRYPHVVWAGFTGDVEPVLQLQQTLEHKLVEFPIKKDERAFRLHLTIGREKQMKGSGPLMGLISELGPIDFGEVIIDHLTLYKSVLTKEGSVYTALKAFHFGKQ